MTPGNEIKENNFRITSKRIKYLRMNLSERVQELWKQQNIAKNFKRSKINGETFHIHALERSVFLKWQFSTVLSIGSTQSLSKPRFCFFLKMPRVLRYDTKKWCITEETKYNLDFIKKINFFSFKRYP